MSDKANRRPVPDQERSTPRPPFDPETFAREAESNLRMVDQQLRGPTRRLKRPELPPLQWGRTSGGAPSGAPELNEQSGRLNALDAVGADAVPIVVLSDEELGGIEISPEARHLLTQVDDVRPLHVVCAMANIAPEDGAAILLDLADRGVVSFL